jgi:hypothetical protein
MTRTIAVAIAVLSLATAGPAFAKGGSGGGGGGGGGTTTAPAPAPVTEPAPDVCDGWWDFSYTDGSSAVVNRGIGGCVIVRSYPAGYLRLDQVANLQPGWTYSVKSNGEGTNSRVLVEFNNASTGEKGSVLVEYGKTVIR